MAAEALRKLIPVLGLYWKYFLCKCLVQCTWLGLGKDKCFVFWVLFSAVVVTVLLLFKLGEKRQGKQAAS